MIYLDHNATTPIDPRVAAAMRPWIEGRHGNPSSSHAIGQEARAAIEEARTVVARTLGCESDEVVFTGGGTEADLLAVLGRCAAAGTGGVVVSAIEHEAVLHAADLAATFGATITRVPPGADGRVDVEMFLDACGPDTVVASLMLASNETGVIQPVAEVAAELRERRLTVHTDAVQAIGKVPVSFRDLGVDLLSISAHKFGGPKGVGALLVRRGTELEALQGGTQEAGRRGGTHAVHSIVGLAEALRLVPERLARMREIETLRDGLEARLCEGLKAAVHGGEAERVPNTCLIGFDGVDAAALLMAADLKGLCLSRGAACASGAEAPSHVLSAMGVPAPLALGTVRLSLGVETTAADIERAVATLTAAVEHQRSAGSARAIH